MGKTVMVFGSFDILHPGHIAFLTQARRYGTKLVVVVARDEEYLQRKGSSPVFTARERMAMVNALNIVDEVLMGDMPGKWKCIAKTIPDVICVGYDQDIHHPALAKQMAQLPKKPRIIRCRAHHPQRWRSAAIKARSGSSCESIN